ncbi:32754_t:CDS:2, partial [Gigaspora margarita]
KKHFLIDILNFIVPKSIKKGFLIPNNTTIKLCISEDSRNVGQKVQHVIIIVVLLNNIKRLHKPKGYYTLTFYSGFENYQSFQNALRFNSANANHFCSWCTYTKQQNRILDQNNKLVGNWTITKNMKQKEHQYMALFDMIDIKNWVYDELHIMLCITD